ncbi:ABC transporter permease [Clostridium beijerinckii]|uniref:ABC transporter permease subunit n=1 Tax=Clostridium beijerinckii TaxID=1520 RepID=A0A7Y8ZA49_CLOBE|nr:ABC transporter permease subunit [Clostridium beijerinckii]NMF03846.1 ABC transporter permease subunit [Clostridium beijerinckii]NOW07594.1 NitT/TauT family transport system permease protein [Clostridium beijerinckii]NRT32951.1 NitT/TauT family transport system permease protein [Clostridium beijerinckii]NRT47624.1 NitT/TauT family transport system permease protein [Clostridium beijerinckii]NRT89746.1 NitT/TauT family transport system permease protein [Clostridium beijerinckii]
MDLQEVNVEKAKNVSNIIILKRNKEHIGLKLLDALYWKPKSVVWRIINIAIFALALLVSFVIPLKQNVILEPYRFFLIILIAYFIVTNIIALFNSKIKAKINHNAQLYSGIGILLIIWDLLTTKSNTLPLPFFPSFAQILQVMVEDYGTLIISTGHSMRLLVIGFTIGTILGTTTGVLIGWYRQWHYWIFPIIKIIGVVPATAWIPIVMFIFPSSFYAQIFLIVICVWFPVAFMTSSGIENLPKSYFEAARTLGAKEDFLVFKVAIPGAMPSIFTGIYTATGISFATLVVSEMIGAKAGLGWYINWAKGWSNYAKVYASIIIMAIVFSIVMAIIFEIRDKVLVWQKGLLK